MPRVQEAKTPKPYTPETSNSSKALPATPHKNSRALYIHFQLKYESYFSAPQQGRQAGAPLGRGGQGLWIRRFGRTRQLIRLVDPMSFVITTTSPTTTTTIIITITTAATTTVTTAAVAAAAIFLLSAGRGGSLVFCNLGLAIGPSDPFSWCLLHGSAIDAGLKLEHDSVVWWKVAELVFWDSSSPAKSHEARSGVRSSPETSLPPRALPHSAPSCPTCRPWRTVPSIRV